MCPERLSGWVLLASAVLTEVCGTLLLRASEGFTRPLVSLGVLVGYGVSILLFSRVLDQGTALGIAYSTLTGFGLISATLASRLIFHDPVAPTQLVGLVLIAAGAVALQLSAPAPTGR